MNKRLKTIISILVCMLLFAVLGTLYHNKVNNHRTDDKGSDNITNFQELPTADTTVKVNGYSTTEMIYASQKQLVPIYETGIQEGVEYTIKKVSLEDSVIDEAGYYKNRGSLEKEIALNVSTINPKIVYEDELRYLYVTVDAYNSSDLSRDISISYFSAGNIREDNAIAVAEHPADWHIWNENGEEIKAADKIRIEAGEKRTMELVFVVKPASIYDFYMEVAQQVWSYYSSIYLDLDLTLKETDGFIFITEGELKSTYELRDMAQMKITHITNKEIMESQTEGTDVLEHYFHEQSETFGEIMEIADEIGKNIYDSKLCSVENVSLVNTYDEIPESFQARNYLKDMTEVYINKYGYQESDIQYLFITIKVEQKQDVEEVFQVTDVSQLMWLYNRDEDNRLWRIGYPDDYEVQEGSDSPSEHMDAYLDYENSVHFITAAYVVWPGALQNVYLWEPGNGVLNEGSKSMFVYDFLDNTAGGVKIELY